MEVLVVDVSVDCEMTEVVVIFLGFSWIIVL